MVGDDTSSGLGSLLQAVGSDAPEPMAVEEAKDPPLVDEIPSCCVATIRQHVRYNPMMVCARCKNIIKCFQDERAYENYLKFCRSRRRPILTGRVEGGYFTVAFRPYDTYNR